MMMMMNCFCGMADRLISSRDHCQRSSPSRISDSPLAGFELAQNLSSGFVEWSCAVAITTFLDHLLMLCFSFLDAESEMELVVLLKGELKFL